MSYVKHSKGIPVSPTDVNSRRKLYKVIRGLSEGEYDVTLIKKRNRWSTGQRNYYWGYLLVEVGRLIGYDREHTHRVLTSMFLASPQTVAGEAMTVVRSLPDLNAVEVSDYFAQVRLWVLEKYRVRLTEPDASLRVNP